MARIIQKATATGIYRHYKIVFHRKTKIKSFSDPPTKTPSPPTPIPRS